MVWMPPKPIKMTATKALEAHSRHLDAHANILNAERLAGKQEQQNQLASKVYSAEQNMSKTSSSLEDLGAGKPYGASR